MFGKPLPLISCISPNFLPFLSFFVTPTPIGCQGDRITAGDCADLGDTFDVLGKAGEKYIGSRNSNLTVTPDSGGKFTFFFVNSRTLMRSTDPFYSVL